MTLLLSRDDVAKVLTMPDCNAAVEGAFAALARGEANMPQRAAIKIDNHHGLFLGMPAYLGGGEECLGLKLVTVYPDNTTGIIETVAVRSGDAVQAGDPLVVLDHSSEELAVARARIAIDAAEEKLTRYQRLQQSRTISSVEVH